MKAKLGIVFAGGRGRRMGAVDKGAIRLGGRPLHDLVLERLSPMCETLAVVAPLRPDWLDGDSVILHFSDEVAAGEPIGPAGALLAGLAQLNALDPQGWLITAAVDAPFFPTDLSEQLAAGKQSAPATIARGEDGVHPTFGLWHAECLAPLRHAIDVKKIFALRKLANLVGAAQVDIQGPSYMFLNINTPDDMERARRVLSSDFDA